MLIIIILLIMIVAGIVAFKFLSKSKSEKPDNSIEKVHLDIKMKSNPIKESMEVEAEKKPLKRPLSPRNAEEVAAEKEEVSPASEEPKEADENKKVEAKNEVLDLDDLFKTISITTEGEDEDFDFGLRNKSDE